MTQPGRCPSVWLRILLAATALIYAAPAFAQTLAGGLNHTVILNSDGTVWTVGADGSGQLGDDNCLSEAEAPST